MSMQGALRLTEEGEWLHDGVPVSHEHIAKYFTKHLRYSLEHGSFVVEVEGKCVAVTVDDVPLFVDEIDLHGGRVRLSNDAVESFAPEALRVSKENVFYLVRVDGSAARLRRNAAQQLYPHISEEGGAICLKVQHRSVPIDSFARKKETDSKL